MASRSYIFDAVCPLCSSTQNYNNLTYYLKHIQLFHSHQPNFSITCGIGGCLRMFKNMRTFRNHISARHSGMDFVDARVYESNANAEGNYNSSCDDTDEADENQDITDVEQYCSDDLTSVSKRSAALFILKLKEKQKLTQVALQSVIEGVTSFFHDHLAALHADVDRKLKDVGVSLSIADMFSQEEFEFRRPFQGLESQHQQITFFRSHFNFIDPICVSLGERRVWKGKGSKRRYIVKKDHVIYVPLLATLQTMLNNGAILAEVMTGHTTEGDTLEDFCDGEAFKSHPLFSLNKQALQIHFYYDDVEVCNPLGSKAKIHKLGIFYFTLGNLRPKFRSRLSAIHIVSLVNHRNLSTYGIDAVIKPFVDDIKKLEEGCSFSIDGREQIMYGSLSVVSADNLGSLALGGFKESCSAYRCCRHCLATRGNAKTKFTETEFTLRERKSHRDQCVLLQGTSAVEVSKTYGINRDALLNELKYFHVCDGALVPDIMHDVLEGALEYEVKLLLKVLIKDERYFSLEVLNSRLDHIDLGYMESKDRPTAIAETTLSSSSNKLKQEAAQMWLLGRVLPIMIGELVPEDDENWALFLKLMDIVDILFCPKIIEDNCAYLAALINDHHEEFKRLYPLNSIIPKMHFMIHMPRLMIQYGPLVCHWTMRYEAKHAYFKKLAQSMGNYINLPYSLAMRHQHLECYNSIESHVIPGDDLEVGPGSVMDPTDLNDDLDITVSSAYEAKWVKMEGNEFRKGAGFIHSFFEDLPQAGQITNIYVVNGNCVVFKAFKFCLTYQPHFHAYTLTQSNLIPHYYFYDQLLLNKSIYIRKPRSIPHHNVLVMPYHVN